MRRLILVTVFTFGCSGELIGGVIPPSPATDEPGERELPPIVCEAKPFPLPSRLVRFDASAYSRTVDALFNWRGQYHDGKVKPPLPFTRPDLGQPFTAMASADIDDFDLDDLLLAARTVAEMYPTYLVTRGGNADFTRAPGSPASQQWFVHQLTNVLFNRPATADEVNERTADFRAAVSSGLTHLEAYDVMMRAMLMSPGMIFREELGGAAGLEPYERIKLLSYGLTGLPPDPTLWRLAATADGGISNDAVLREQLQRLTAEPARLGSLRRFITEFYGWNAAPTVNKDGATGHNPARLITNTEDLVEALVATHARKGLLRALLTSPTPSTDSETGQSWFGKNGTPATTPPRAGVMTHPAWLVAFSEMDHNNLVRRGRFIRERLLCTPVPQLPGGVVPAISTAPGKSYRQRLEEQTSGASCSGCHQLMNGLGGAFEGFDHLGRPQTMDNGARVDTSGVLDGIANGPVPFSNATELMNGLASAPEVHACFLRNLFTFYVGRVPTREDECELKRLEAVYVASGEDTLAVIEELFVWQASTPRVPSE